MRVFVSALCLALVSAAPARASAEEYFPRWPVELQTDVLKIARGFSGEFAVYVKDLSTGTRYSFNGATPMYLASGIKIAVMVALFRQIQAKQGTLQDELVYSEKDLRDGAPLLNFLRVGTPVSLQILLEAMIQQSDNAATDMLINHVGLENVNRGLVEEGMYGFGPVTTLIDVRRLVYRNIDPRTAQLSPGDIFKLGNTRPLQARMIELARMLGEPPGTYSVGDFDRGFRSYYEAGLNSASMEAMAALLEGIVRGKVVSGGYSKEMLEVLLGTQTGARRIRAGLPPGTPLAHKTGTQYRRICDFGVFYMPGDRPIVFVVSVKDGRSRRASEAVIANLVRRTYWHLASPEERRKLQAVPEEKIVEKENDKDDGGELDEESLLDGQPARPSPSKPKVPKKKRTKKRVSEVRANGGASAPAPAAD